MIYDYKYNKNNNLSLRYNGIPFPKTNRILLPGHIPKLLPTALTNQLADPPEQTNGVPAQT